MWRSIADLSAKRWKCGLVELGGFLYAVGGMDSPRAGFWGAPLNTGDAWRMRSDAASRDRYLIYLSEIFLQLNATVLVQTSGLQRNLCMKHGKRYI